RRPYVRHLPRNRVDPALRDDISRKRLAGQRVVDGLGDLGKDALAHKGRRNSRYLGAALIETESLIVPEEECAVPRHWSSERTAKLVRFERRFGLRKVASGIQRIVAEIFEH